MLGNSHGKGGGSYPMSDLCPECLAVGVEGGIHVGWEGLVEQMRSAGSASVLSASVSWALAVGQTLGCTPCRHAQPAIAALWTAVPFPTPRLWMRKWRPEIGKLLGVTEPEQHGPDLNLGWRQGYVAGGFPAGWPCFSHRDGQCGTCWEAVCAPSRWTVCREVTRQEVKENLAQGAPSLLMAMVSVLLVVGSH